MGFFKKDTSPKVDPVKAAQTGTAGNELLEDRDERVAKEMSRSGGFRKRKGRSSSVRPITVLRVQLVILLGVQAVLLGALGMVVYSVIMAFIGR